MGRYADPYRIKQQAGYWYYKLRDESTFHSTRIPVKNPKTSRRKAELFCEKLTAVSAGNRGFQTFGEYADQYFSDDSCPWWTRQTGAGKSTTVHTRQQHRNRLDAHILPMFRNHRFSELSPIAIERWIFSLDYSSQWKKHIYNTMKIIIDDLRREQLISFSSADMRPPVVRNAEKVILSDEDALKLFPPCLDDFRAVWGQSFSLGVFLALLYSTGLRTSEARALPWAAMNWRYRGLKICQTINRDGLPWVPKGKAVRVVILPRFTMRLLLSLPTAKNRTGLIFPGREGAVLDIGSAAHALRRMVRVKEISANVTPHGLRHTYNTRMRAILSEAAMSDNFSDSSGFLSATEATDKILRAFTGHKSPNMTELYDHPELDKKLEFISRNFAGHVNMIWDICKERNNG